MTRTRYVCLSLQSSTYGKAAAAAIGRAMDDEIIDALGGTAKTGVSVRN